MNRQEKIRAIRQKLAAGQPSIGSWMQVPSSSIAEIMGQAGFDWVAIDLEHGAVSLHQLPDIFRALELGGTLPLARLAEGQSKDCKQALDAGSGGVIVPMIESAEQLEQVRENCCWPPAGKRGVGFSRANLFGKNFEEYSREAQSPLLVAMIENVRALNNLEKILRVKGLDAIFVGPYDLSASLGITAKFDAPEFMEAMNQIKHLARKEGVPYGMHVVMPDPGELAGRIREGYSFVAYSIDTVFLNSAVTLPRAEPGEK